MVKGNGVIRHDAGVVGGDVSPAVAGDGVSRGASAGHGGSSWGVTDLAALLGDDDGADGVDDDVAVSTSGDDADDDNDGSFADGDDGLPVGSAGSSSPGSDASGVSDDGVSAGFVSGVKTGMARRRLSERDRRLGLVEPSFVDPGAARKMAVAQWRRGRRATFTVRDQRALDFLVRWSYGTTLQVARAAGFTDTRERRLRSRFEGYAKWGWATEDAMFAGPVLWYPSNAGAELSSHAWLGGVSARRVNPATQSHSLGLSSVASFLLAAAWAGTGVDVLGLGDEWAAVASELHDGSAFVVGEREYRSRWSTLRQRYHGLIAGEYRHGLRRRLVEWRDAMTAGSRSLADSPELAACEPGFMGRDLWLWTLWGNYVLNESGGLVPVEDRGVDPSTGRPVVNRDLGDVVALQDHLPDLIVARRRSANGSARSLAVELELTLKSVDEYARIMASYASWEGRALFERVIWLTPSAAIARAVAAGAARAGVSERVFACSPVATLDRRNSFWSGADVLPARWDDMGRVIPWTR
jgi:hypothetical protein